MRHLYRRANPARSRANASFVPFGRPVTLCSASINCSSGDCIEFFLSVSGRPESPLKSRRVDAGVRCSYSAVAMLTLPIPLEIASYLYSLVLVTVRVILHCFAVGGAVFKRRADCNNMTLVERKTNKAYVVCIRYEL